MHLNERLTKIAPSLALVLLLGLVPALAAARPADPPPGPPDQEMGPGMGPEMMLDHMTRYLDLSDQQRQDLAAAFASHREAVRSDGEKMKAAWDALEKQIHAEVFDESAIRQASAAVSALQADRAVDRGKLFQQIRGILTAEQLQKFEEMRQQHRERMHGRGGGPGGPHHGPMF